MSEMKYDPSMFEKLDESEKNDEAIAMESKTFLTGYMEKILFQQTCNSWTSRTSHHDLIGSLCSSFSQYTYDGQDLANTNALPSAAHLLGTDKTWKRYPC